MWKTKMLKYEYVKNYYNLYVQTNVSNPSPSPPRKNKQTKQTKTKTETKMFRLKGVKNIKKYIYVSSF